VTPRGRPTAHAQRNCSSAIAGLVLKVTSLGTPALLRSGDQVSFSNYVANADATHYVTPRIKPVRLTPDHILASGSLPPAFPMTVIDGVPYWDGGLFDNTPIETLLDLLEDNELDHLPIFIVNLFATHSALPTNLQEVQERMVEISFESRFLLAHADADGSLREFTTTIEELMRDLPQDSPARGRESFRRLVRFRALKNIRIIEADHAPMTGGLDFSVHGVRSRFTSGYEAVDGLFENPPRSTTGGEGPLRRAPIGWRRQRLDRHERHRTGRHRTGEHRCGDQRERE
jgi:hypothetical protein